MHSSLHLDILTFYHFASLSRALSSSTDDTSHKASLLRVCTVAYDCIMYSIQLSLLNPQAVELVKGAVDTLQSMLKDTLSLCQLPDVCGIQPYGPQLSFELHSTTQGLYTAGEGLLVEAELVMANFLLQISERYVEEERQERTKQQQKTYTQQVHTVCTTMQWCTTCSQTSTDD